MEKFDYPSSSSSAVYTVQINDDLHLSCNCPAWRIKKEGKPRDCKHCKDVVKKLNLTIEVRDVYQFVAGVGEVETKIPAAIAAPTPIVAAGAAPAKDRYIAPMMASPMPDEKSIEDYDPALWIMDEKWDGHRVGVSVYNGVVQAWSRPRPGTLRGLDRTLPKHIVDALVVVPNGFYDGEIIVKGGQSWDVTAGSNSGKERLKFFDVMEILDINVMSKPFEDRREILETSLSSFIDKDPERAAFSLSPLYPVSKATLREIWDRKGEGVILKRRDSVYRSNWRADTWIKIKELFSATLTITGYKEGKNGPYSTVLLRDDDGNETSAKTVNNEWLRILNAKAAQFVGRRLVIEHRGRTPTGNYRHAMWDHLEDEPTI